MKRRTARQGGFTLVEIMIVVAIIGLLASIAIPNFVKARTTAQMHACISNLQQIDGAIQMWATETGADTLPYLKNSVTCPSGGKTFADSYAVSTVQTKPTCLKVPTTHKLDETLQ